MNFGQLKSHVESAMGRSDVPDYVYTLTTAGVNRDCRFLDMEGYVEIPLTSQVGTLPSDFLSIISIHIRISGQRRALENVTTQTARIHAESGPPRYYAIKNGGILVNPDPDGEYDLYVDYVAALPDLAGNADTNDIMARYPDLYLYQALTHAAIWSKDVESQQSYGSAYGAALKAAKRDDLARRNSLGIRQRSVRGGF